MIPTLFIAATTVRWLTLLATAVVLGSLVLARVVVPRERPEWLEARRRLRQWTMLGATVLLVTALAELLLRAQTMSAAGLGQTIAAIPVVLARTHYGAIWIARIAGLAIILSVLVARPSWAEATALGLALAVALSTSLTGHAGDWGDLSLIVFADWAHVVAASAWTGGLLGLALLGFPNGALWPQPGAGAVARRFSRLAGVCLLFVVLSGAHNAWVQIPAVTAFWTTTYGRTLGIKLVVFVVLVGLGALNRYVVVPRLAPAPTLRGVGYRLFRLARLGLVGPSRASTRDATLQCSRYITGEAVLAVFVFGATAVLGDLPPARHAKHTQHLNESDTERGPIHVTMAELHAGGGVPKGWQFRPTPGDATRGRQVFVRLECFACHTVQGEGFPAPSHPGPDLTGMGSHHPTGYLAESIMNPNAVIVDGPGYTGPDGKSIMPDYGSSLTVGDLNDVVAYLKSLEEEPLPSEQSAPSRGR